MGGSPMANSAIGVIIGIAQDGSFSCSITTLGGCRKVKQQMVEMTLNGSGVRDTARVLGVSPTTVLSTLKKKRRRCTQ